MGDDSGRQDTVAARLSHLFETVHPKGRKPYTLEEAARGINEKAGRQVVSVSSLSRLKTGARTSPAFDTIAAIADWFGVPPGYFTSTDVAARVDSQLELAKTLQDTTVAAIAMRSAGLSERSLRAILAMVENARSLEDLGDRDSGDEAG